MFCRNEKELVAKEDFLKDLGLAMSPKESGKWVRKKRESQAWTTFSRTLSHLHLYCEIWKNKPISEAERIRLRVLESDSVCIIMCHHRAL